MDTANEDKSDVSRTGVIRRRRVTVEPAMLVVMIGIGLTSPITVQYINQRVEQKYNITSGTSNCFNDSNDDINDTSIEEQMEQEVATWSLALSAAGAFPMLISTTIFATMSDSIGRKIPLFVSCIGMIAVSLSFICIAYFSLPLIYLVLSNLVWNCFGGYQLFFSVSAAYIADIALKRKRTMKFILLQTLVLVGAGVAEVGVGYWVQASGFIPPYCLATVLYIMVLPYIVNVIPETITNKQSCCSVFGRLFSSVKTLFALNENNRRFKLMLLLLCHFLVFSTIMYYTHLIMLKVLAQPFCWGSVLIGYFYAAQPILGGVGLLFGGYILSRCLGDYGMIQVGLLSGILLMISTGFSSTTAALFVVVVIGSLRGISIAVFMSRLSKTVGDEEQGTLFAFVGALEGLGLFLAPLTLGSMYKMTAQTYPPAVFITMTGLLSVAMVFVWILKIMDLNSHKTYRRLVDSSDSPIKTEDDDVNIIVNESTDD